MTDIQVRPEPTAILLTRVAESAYWAGRYLERVETMARLIRSHTELFLDLPRSAGLRWSPLLAVTGNNGVFVATHGAPTEDRVVAFLVAEPDGGSSIRSALAAVHHNLRVTRPVMPVEAVEVLNDLVAHVAATAPAAVDRVTRLEWLTGVIRRCQMLNGLLTDTMAHDEAFGFFTIGRQLERADLTTRVLDVEATALMGRAAATMAPYADVCWAAGLRSLNALDACRKRFGGNDVTETVRFLLHDPQCPRSVETCLTVASRHMLELPGHEEPMAAAARLTEQLRSVEDATLVDGALHDFVDEVQSAIDDIHGAIGQCWFPADGEQTA